MQNNSQTGRRMGIGEAPPVQLPDIIKRLTITTVTPLEAGELAARASEWPVWRCAECNSYIVRYDPTRPARLYTVCKSTTCKRATGGEGTHNVLQVMPARQPSPPGAAPARPQGRVLPMAGPAPAPGQVERERAA